MDNPEESPSRKPSRVPTTLLPAPSQGPSTSEPDTGMPCLSLSETRSPLRATAGCRVTLKTSAPKPGPGWQRTELELATLRSVHLHAGMETPPRSPQIPMIPVTKGVYHSRLHRHPPSHAPAASAWPWFPCDRCAGGGATHFAIRGPHALLAPRVTPAPRCESGRHLTISHFFELSLRPAACVLLLMPVHHCQPRRRRLPL